MFNFKSTALSVVAAALLIGCGSSDSSTSTPTTKVIYEDESIIGARMVDANGSVATEVGSGVYKFSKIAVKPISIESENNATHPNNTFQDMDNDGKWTSGVDIPYNVSLKIQWSESDTYIGANAKTAKIPANWDGNSSIGGYDATTIKLISSKGIKNSKSDLNSTVYKQLKDDVAKTTALMESAILLGLDANQTYKIIDTMDVNETNLSAALNTIDLGDNTLETALQSIADDIDNSDLSDTNESEVIINVVSDIIEQLKITYDNNITQVSQNFDINQSQVTDGINELETGKENSALKTLVESLNFVPVYDENGNIFDTTMTNNLTDFSLSYSDTTKKITLNATGIDDLFFVGEEFTLNTDETHYSFVEGTSEARINLNANGTRALLFTTDNTSDNWHIYALATQEQIDENLADGDLTQAQVDEISTFN